MAHHWHYFLFLLWLAYLLVSSVLMFTRGFLLTRVSLMEHSACAPFEAVGCHSFDDASAPQCSHDERLATLLSDLQDVRKTCLPKHANVVLLVVDALRYDFTLLNASVGEALPFQNKLPVLAEMREKHRDRTRLYKMLADPPTTTMQRLKAITTGSLPTFIDAGSNFATPEIEEDNIIDQLNRQNRTVVFLGDDTWMGLFPKRFKRSYPFPSFNVWDLDTVDTGVVQHLFDEMKKKDWDLLIGHFLGVDHAGHRYGPNHPEMERKLTEINGIIKRTIEELDYFSVLIVVGDHGMTKTGDHGGESPAETETAMFVYSHTPLVASEKVLGRSTRKQIDLIPTISTLLGIPIPYSNLGSVVLDAIPMSTGAVKDWKLSLASLWNNVLQITDYIGAYSRLSEQLDENKLAEVAVKFSALNASLGLVRDEEELKAFILEAKSYMDTVRQMCEEVWVQFDSYSMSRGLLLMFLSIFFVFVIMDGIPVQRMPEIFRSRFLACSLAGQLGGAGVAYALFCLGLAQALSSAVFFATGIVSVFMLAMLAVQNWDLITSHWHRRFKSRNFLALSTRAVAMLSVVGLFTNSYILEESSVSSFLLATLLVVVLQHYRASRQGSRSSFRLRRPPIVVKLAGLVLGGLVLVRASHHFWRCREEQPHCTTFAFNSEEPAKTTGKADFLWTLVSLALVVTSAKAWLRDRGNLVGSAPTVLMAKYAPTVIVVCTCGFWALHQLPKSVEPWKADMLAWVAYGLAGAALVCLYAWPLCVHTVPRKRDVLSFNQSGLVPELFAHLRHIFGRKEAGDADDDVPVVYGLGTVFSAAFVNLATLCCLLAGMLLGDSLAPSAAIMFFVVVLVAVVLSVCVSEQRGPSERMFDVPGVSIVCWSLLSLYFFYGTGHQAAFPNIHWSAAFVGTGGAFRHNAIPAALIGYNTFCSQIVVGLMLPLLLIFPFTLNASRPTWMDAALKRRDLQQRGELILYEKDESFTNGLFVASAKYILMQGIRIFVCMLAATIHCRHLMVWRIFAPKLIFESLGLFVSLPSVLLGYLLVVRINVKVNDLMAILDKRNRTIVFKTALFCGLPILMHTRRRRARKTLIAAIDRTEKRKGRLVKKFVDIAIILNESRGLKKNY